MKTSRLPLDEAVGETLHLWCLQSFGFPTDCECPNKSFWDGKCIFTSVPPVSRQFRWNTENPVSNTSGFLVNFHIYWIWRVVDGVVDRESELSWVLSWKSVQARNIKSWLNIIRQEAHCPAQWWISLWCQRPAIKERGQPTQLTSQFPDFFSSEPPLSLLFNHSVLVFDNNKSPDSIMSCDNVTDSDVVCCEWKFVEKVMMWHCDNLYVDVVWCRGGLMK